MPAKILFPAIILAIYSIQIQAQNLVPNPGFETGIGCRLDTFKWFDPTDNNQPVSKGFGLTNSCNYANQCGKGQAIFQKPRNGHCSLLMFVWYQNPDSGYHYYAEVKLLKPLIAKEKYYCSYYLSLLDLDSDKYTSDFGMYFSDTICLEKNRLRSEPSLLKFKPQVNNPTNRMLRDTLNWMKVNGFYQAHGGEQYILIGDFADKAEAHFSAMKKLDSLYPAGGTGWSYGLFRYYLDDATVTPVKSLKRTDTVCKSNSNWIHARYKGVNIQWPDSSTGDSFLVSKEGVYPAIYDSMGYAAIDSIRVLFRNLAPGVHDTALCTGQSYTLKLPNTNTYNWNDGSKADSIFINKAGTYWVQVSNGTCAYTDTMLVRYDKPISFHFPADTLICSNKTWLVNLDSLPFKVKWQDGSTQKQYKISKGGTYKIAITTGCGVYSQNIEVGDSDCAGHLYVPNALSPGSTAEEERIFLPKGSFLYSYHLQIYNTWGELLWENSELENGHPKTGWDGRSQTNGKPLPQGVYVWKISARFLTGKYWEGMDRDGEKKDIGSISLIR